MKELTTFNYQGQDITFDFTDGNKMINATEMGKAFNKLPKDFLKSKQINEYIILLSRKENCPIKKIINVLKVGNQQVTWMHRLLALRFAQWLSPKFSLWVDERTQELIIKGHVSINRQLSTLDILEMTIQQMRAQEKRIDHIEDDVRVLKAKSIGSGVEEFSIKGYANYLGISCNRKLAAQLGKKASQLCRQKNITTDKIKDERFGTVKIYPEDILKIVFQDIKQ